ncbi:MAG TPA: MFS transporter [Candidatus Paceibacterota bacterium]|jgi:MFS family permease|nr:MFS transporter [Candidatus Paceibacterota bacterium]
MKHPFKLLYSISFIFSIQYALVVYINSSFLETAVSEKLVGLIFTVASILSILVLLEMPRVLSRFGNYKTTIFFVLANSLVLLSMGFAKSSYVIVISFLLYTVTNYCLVLTRDVFIEEFTVKGIVGRTRGSFLTIINLALVIAPSIAVFTLSRGSYFGVYALAALFTFSSFFFIFPHLKNFKDPLYKKISVRETLTQAGRDIDLKRIYFSEFLLCFFYSWMIIYTPIYLHQYIGFEWKSIGAILTVMLVPFVLLDYPLGRLSDTIGERKLLIFGFFIIAVATITIYFLNTKNIFVWALVLFMTRIGAATIEVMDESYFFKKINASDAGLIGVYRNMFPFAFIIGPLLAICILFFVPSFEYLFFVLGAIMLLGFLSALRLQDAK